MATVTPNFNWPVPTSTDLVKDGATAMEALGDSIDASFVGLKGGNTDQVLAKGSPDDLDFVWVDANPGDITGVTAGTGISGGGTSGTVTVTNSMATAIDAKGDLIAGTAADAFSRIAVGANNTKLVAASGEATGLKYVGFQGASVWKSASQNATSAAQTTITFDTEVFDTDSFHDNSTNNSRLTIPAGMSGKYLVTAKADFAANVTGQRVVYHLVDGTLVNFAAIAPPQSGGGGAGVTLSAVYNLTAGQYVEMAVYQDSGTTLAITGTAYYYTNMQITYLGA
jgi:hypothetical protein